MSRFRQEVKNQVKAYRISINKTILYPFKLSLRASSESE